MLASKLGHTHYGRARIAALTYFQLARDAIAELRKSKAGGMGHACEFETAMMQHVRPELVDIERAETTYPDPGSPYLTTDLIGASTVCTYHDFGDLSLSGTLGDPSLATPESGARFFEAVADRSRALPRGFCDVEDPGRAMSRILRVGVIGLGWFGARHAQVYRQLPNAQIIGVSDTDLARCEAVAAGASASVFTDFRALLALPHLDAVSICLPDRSHAEAAKAAAEVGKAILVEKPLAHDAATARDIVDAVERNRTRLMVGHILRFDPRYVQVFEAAAREKLGDVIHVRAKRNATRSTGEAPRRALVDPLLHGRARCRRNAVDRAVAYQRGVYAQKREVLGSGNEDTLYAVVNFENGAIGSLDYSWAWPDGLMNGYRAAFEIVGTRTAAYLDVADQGFYTVDDAGTEGGDTHLWPEINGRIVGRPGRRNRAFRRGDSLPGPRTGSITGRHLTQYRCSTRSRNPLGQGCPSKSGAIDADWLAMVDSFQRSRSLPPDHE